MAFDFFYFAQLNHLPLKLGCLYLCSLGVFDEILSH